MSLCSSRCDITQVTVTSLLEIRLNLRLHSSVWLMLMLRHYRNNLSQRVMQKWLHHRPTSPEVWRSSGWGDGKELLLFCCFLSVNPATFVHFNGKNEIFWASLCFTKTAQKYQPLLWFVEKSISCVDCVGMSSLVPVSLAEFYLASCNDEVFSVPVIILASFSSLLMLKCKAVHVLSVWVCLTF